MGGRELVEEAAGSLPEPFATHLEQMSIEVQDRPTKRQLEELDLDEGELLLGLHEGVPLPERSVEHSGTLPDRIRLFRRSLLDEWSSGGVTLERLVAHVLIHEVGHHFGFSDDDMHALEESVE